TPERKGNRPRRIRLLGVTDWQLAVVRRCRTYGQSSRIVAAPASTAPAALGTRREHAAIERRAAFEERAAPLCFREQAAQRLEIGDRSALDALGVRRAQRHDARSDEQAPNAAARRLGVSGTDAHLAPPVHRESPGATL